MCQRESQSIKWCQLLSLKVDGAQQTLKKRSPICHCTALHKLLLIPMSSKLKNLFGVCAIVATK